MGDRAVVVAALCAAGVALAAGSVPEPLWVTALVAVTVVALALRSLRGPQWSSTAGTAVVVILVVVAVGWRASSDLAGLERPLPGRVEATVELAADPEPGPFGTRAILIAEGRRWSATFGRDREWVVRHLRMGERLWLRGEPAPLVGARESWVRSEHLAGRLRVLDTAPAQGSRPWFRAANRVLTMLERGAASFDDRHRSLYLGLVVGDDRDQDDVTRHRFRAVGLTHLLAVSGQNVAFVLAALAPLSRRLPLRWRTPCALGVLAAFVLITRAEPSVLRAATMAGLAVWASASGRAAPGIRVVALAVVALLLADPLLVHAAGFRLSVAATLGLVVCRRPLEGVLPGPDWLRRPLAVVLAAQVGAVPAMAAMFGESSVLGVVANLLAEPAAGVVMTLGVAIGPPAGLLHGDAAAAVMWPVQLLVRWVDAVAVVGARLTVPPLGLGGWAAVAGGGALAVALHRRAGAGRGHTVPGRSLTVVLVPLVLLARPAPWPTEAQILTPGVEVAERCGHRGVALSTSVPSGEVLDALWRAGLGGVDEVTVPTYGGVGRVGELVDALGADGPVPVASARGSPCARR